MDADSERIWRSPTRGPAGFVRRVLRKLGVRRRYLVLGGPDDPLEEASATPVEAARLAPDELDEYLAFRPDQSRETIQRRLDEGGICFVGRSGGRMVAAIWTALGSVRLDYVPCRLWLGERTFSAYDLYVDPALRGQRVAEPVTRLRKHALAEAGYAWKVAVYGPRTARPSSGVGAAATARSPGSPAGGSAPSAGNASSPSPPTPIGSCASRPIRRRTGSGRRCRGRARCECENAAVVT